MVMVMGVRSGHSSSIRWTRRRCIPLQQLAAMFVVVAAVVSLSEGRAADNMAPDKTLLSQETKADRKDAAMPSESALLEQSSHVERRKAASRATVKENKISDCTAGQFWSADDKLCVSCEPGSFSSKSGAANCTVCPPGTFSNRNTGFTACTNCPMGQSSKEGFTNCEPCSSGLYSPRPGSLCLKCEPGYFSGVGYQYCASCRPGSYSAKYGSSTCSECGLGHYGLEIAAKSFSMCQECPAGHRCPNKVNMKPVPCPEDTEAKMGSDTCRACPFLFYSPAKSDVCTASAMLVILIAATLLLFFVICIWICRKNRPMVDKPPLGDSFVAKPPPPPLYTGL